MRPAADDKIKFLMRANPDQVAYLERLMQHTGQRVRTKAVWAAVERYPEMADAFEEARREIDGLQELLARAALAIETAAAAARDRDAVLEEIQSAARVPPEQRRSARETLYAGVYNADLR